MPLRALFATMLALLFLWSVSTAAPIEGDDSPSFQLGFKNLADQIPDVAGVPIEDEHHNPYNGDGLQQTSTGLMVWRKSDNWTAFTNGWWTWVNGPYGVQERSNAKRFEWEGQEEEATMDSSSPGEDVTLVSRRPEQGLPNTGTSGSQPPYGAPLAGWSPTPTAESSQFWQPTITPAPLPTSTSVPRATQRPTSTARPSSTPRPSATPKPTATPVPNGTRSPDPAGEWVTSVAASTKYYCSKDSSYWKSWSASNRIWFPTESALLAAYPARTRHD